MATRKHRDVYVTDERWDTFVRQAGNLHSGDRLTDAQIDNTFEAALRCFRRASPAEVGDCMDLGKRLKTQRESTEATAASASS